MDMYQKRRIRAEMKIKKVYNLQVLTGFQDIWQKLEDK